MQVTEGNIEIAVTETGSFILLYTSKLWKEVGFTSFLENA